MDMGVLRSSYQMHRFFELIGGDLCWLCSGVQVGMSSDVLRNDQVELARYCRKLLVDERFGALSVQLRDSLDLCTKLMYRRSNLPQERLTCRQPCLRHLE